MRISVVSCRTHIMARKTIKPDGSERISVSPVVDYALIVEGIKTPIDSGRCTNAKSPQCPLYNDTSGESVRKYHFRDRTEY